MGFTSFGGAGGPGFSPTAFTTTFTDSAYTATPGERVISNGATVTMPSSPTAGDVVLVGRVGSSSVSIQPNGNELIETADVGYIEQDSTVALISDGSDWYAVDGSEFVSAIPDSGALHEWYLNEGSGTTAQDNISNADMSLSGEFWQQGVGVGDYVLNFDGSDNEASVSSSDLNNWTDSGAALFQAYPRDLNSRQYFFFHQTNRDRLYFEINGSLSSGLRIALAGSTITLSGLNTSDISTNEWQGFALSWDNGSFDVYIYDFATSSIKSTTGTYTGSAQQNGDLYFGSEGGDDYLDAKMDFPALFDDYKTENEIANFFDDVGAFY